MLQIRRFFCKTFILVLFSFLVFVSCGDDSSITFETFKVNGTNLSGTVSSDTGEFDFKKEVKISGKAKYTISTDKAGKKIVSTQKVPLSPGDNTFYLIASLDDSRLTYTVKIRRIPKYTIRFDEKGGSEISDQLIEEGKLVSEPDAPTREGYSFAGWDYDFSTPVTGVTVITAKWNTNGDTPYKVEYYRENVKKDGYDLITTETENLTGETDTVAYAEEKKFNYFTLNTSKSELSGNISGDGSLVLKVYYTRNYVLLSNANTNYGSIIGSGSYTYGSAVKATATPKPGYDFTGWYNGNTLLSTNTTYNYNIKSNVEARFALKPGLEKFEFTGTATTITITGVKDKSVKEIIVPDCVTSIGSSAFYNCTGLTSVIIPDSVTSIDSYAFENCTGLTSIIIPDSVTKIGYRAFEDCTGLINVIIGNGVETIDYKAFLGCENLMSVTLGRSVKKINDEAFWSEKLVEVINYSSLYITKGSDKNGRIAKFAIEVHSGNSKVSNKNGYIFYTYDGVNYLLDYIGTETELNLPTDYNGETYEIYKEAFTDRRELTSIIMPDSVTSIGENAFSGCDSITSVTLGSELKNIGEYAFYSCTKLTNLTIPSSVTSIGEYAFYHCYDLKNISFKEESQLLSIGEYAFCSCDGLTNITIPDDVNAIGEYAFYDCDGLNSVTIGKSVSVIGENSFRSCSGLKSVTIGEGVALIGEGSFSGCSSLESITLPLGDNSMPTCPSFGYIFGTSSYSGGVKTTQGEKTYYIPQTLKTVSITGTKIYVSALSNCSGLTSIIIGSGVTIIGDGAFSGCSGLTSVTIGNGVKSIGYKAFDYCKGLDSITIPNSVTSIGDYAFYRCFRLGSVTIGSGVKSIGSFAFYNCQSLDSINYRGTETQWYEITKGVYWDVMYYGSTSSDKKINYTMTYNYTGK